MKAGRIFELFVKYMLLNVGFSEVKSDGITIYDGSAGQMIHGLGDAHNADVLVQPPVQIPFYAPSRLLIECKDYKDKVGIDVVRGALGLREDINNFKVLDENIILHRHSQKRVGKEIYFPMYSYQIAVASTSGFSIQAQNFAMTYRIPLLEFNRMPFWNDMYKEMRRLSYCCDSLAEIEESINKYVSRLVKSILLAVTNTGQILFLFEKDCAQLDDDFYDLCEDYYTIHWSDVGAPWELRIGNKAYLFQLPEWQLKQWIEHSSNELELKKNAIDCKAEFMSNMIIYFMHNNKADIRMITIDKYALSKARENLECYIRNAEHNPN